MPQSWFIRTVVRRGPNRRPSAQLLVRPTRCARQAGPPLEVALRFLRAREPSRRKQWRQPEALWAKRASACGSGDRRWWPERVRGQIVHARLSGATSAAIAEAFNRSTGTACRRRTGLHDGGRPPSRGRCGRREPGDAERGWLPRVSHAARALDRATMGEGRELPAAGAAEQPLTERESEVLRLFASGIRTRQIAHELRASILDPHRPSARKGDPAEVRRSQPSRADRTHQQHRATCLTRNG